MEMENDMKTGNGYISVVLTLALTIGALACGPGGATGSGGDELADDGPLAGDSETGDGDGDNSTDGVEAETGGSGCGETGDGDGDEPPPLAGCCVCDEAGSWCEALGSEADCDALGMAWGAPTEWYPDGCELIGDEIVCDGSCEMPAPIDGWCCDCATVGGPLPFCQPIGDGCGEGWCEIGPEGNPGECAETCG